MAKPNIKADFTPYHLDNGPLQLFPLYKDAITKLKDLLRLIENRKSIITNIPGFVTILLRQKKDCEEVNATGISIDFRKRDDIGCYVYIIREDMTYLETIEDHLKKHSLPVHLILVPRFTAKAAGKLKSLNILNRIASISNFTFDIFPLDYDLITMYKADSFKELLLHQDLGCLYDVKLAINKIQHLFGPIRNLHGRGPYAEKVVKILQRENQLIKHANKHGAETPALSQIGHLIIIDRTMDLKTVLLFQKTYEGMLDEVIGIDLGRYEQGSGGERRYIYCNSSNEIYATLRFEPISNIGAIVKQMGKELDEKKAACKESSTDTSYLTYELSLQRLSLQLISAQNLLDSAREADHSSFVDAADAILTSAREDTIFIMLEELIAQNAPLPKVLRLMCLQSIVNDGLSKEMARLYFNSIVQSYGLKHLFTLKNCLKTGLIRIKNTEKGVFPKMIKELLKSRPRMFTKTHETYDKIVQDYINSIKGYTISGGSTLSSSAASELMGDKSIVSKLLSSSFLKGSKQELQTASESEVALIFIIGGVNYDEILSLRKLSNRSNIKFIIATTDIINGDKLINSMTGAL